MSKKAAPAVAKPLVFPRADPAALASFGMRTKVCTMNCGPHAQDPRSAKERRFLCGDCLEIEAPDGDDRQIAEAGALLKSHGWTCLPPVNA